MSAADGEASEEERLSELRERIDTIDEQLQRLLNERAACALEVGEVKQARRGEAMNTVFFRPEREAQILTRIRERNEGPLSADAIATLFREIISCCLSLEQPLTIAYLGPAGTYTEAAATKQFGHFATTRAQSAIDEVFREVEAGAVHYGVVPVENSTEGMVNHTLDCFMTSALKICAEVELPIHHCLLAPASVGPDAVTEIVSHAQSLAQCRAWLDANYPDVPRTAVASNGEAAKQVAERSDAAAIASAVAGDRYGLRALATNIEDQADNKTRFLVIDRPAGCGSERTRQDIHPGVDPQ